MSIEIRKRGDEKTEAMLRRFNRVVQTSGLLRTIKETKFYFKPKTRRQRREEAKRKAIIKRFKKGY